MLKKSQGAGIFPGKAGIVEEVHGRIAAKAQFRSNQHICSALFGFACKSDNLFPVAGKITDNGIHLTKRDFHFGLLTFFPVLEEL
jgi:hypothetical protein